jgi:outer membrane receptor protein involved in Fe transport
MLDRAFEPGRFRIRIVGGARTERWRQEVNTVKAIDDQEPFTAALHKTDVLPSAALTINPSSSVNIRLSYNHSVNRPEFREMANVLYYDLDRTQNVLGNPGLKRAAIRNYDARIETFMGEGELLALSWFHKDIEDAIEEKLIPAPERYTRTWFNSPSGKNAGWELEIRKSLGFLGRFFERFSFVGNYTKVNSSIEYSEARTNELGEQIVTKAERSMQGQAPWTANASFMYTELRWGTSINVLYNKLGRRLDAVGDTRDEDVYEESRDLVDCSINQEIGDQLDVKFTVKNMGGKNIAFTSGPLAETYSTLSRSTVYSLSFSYRF